MKKTIFAILMMSIAAFAFAQNGIIKEMVGEVELKPAGTTAFVPAKAGDTVAPNTIVSTGFRSTAIIQVGSAIVAVRPLTRLSLTEIQATAKNEILNMNLNAGRVKVDIKPPAGSRASLSMQSPSATASVRGTSFYFDTRNLRVHEGKVAFQGKSGMPRAVYAGSSSRVGMDGNAINPAIVDTEALAPAPPVGTDQNNNAAGAPSVPNGEFVVGVEY